MTLTGLDCSLSAGKSAVGVAVTVAVPVIATQLKNGNRVRAGFQFGLQTSHIVQIFN